CRQGAAHGAIFITVGRKRGVHPLRLGWVGPVGARSLGPGPPGAVARQDGRPRLSTSPGYAAAPTARPVALPGRIDRSAPAGSRLASGASFVGPTLQTGVLGLAPGLRPAHL